MTADLLTLDDLADYLQVSAPSACLLEQLAQELEEAGTVAQLRDAVRLPTVVVRAGLRVLEQMGVLELDGDRYWRRTTVLAVEEAVLEAIRLGAHTWGAVSRAVSCPGSLVDWSLAGRHTTVQARLAVLAKEEGRR